MRSVYFRIGTKRGVGERQTARQTEKESNRVLSEIANE